MAETVFPSRLSVPHISLGPCARCSTPLEYLPPPTSSSDSHRILCFHCGNIFTYSLQAERDQRDYQAKRREQQQQQQAARKGRSIGSDERPLETAYYDLLGVPVDATTEDIKRAYRRLAIKNHPDKGGSEELFKDIAVAYHVLSDPELRKKYNERGSKEGLDGGFVDPEEVFSAIFGGERFVPIIGDISLGKEMKAALQEADETTGNEESSRIANGGKPRLKDAKGKDILSPEEKANKEEKERKVAAERAKAREARVQKLVVNLERKLSIFTESATGVNDQDVVNSWTQICALEAEDLKRESYGVELLHAVGFTYIAKARHYAASNSTLFGVGGWMHGIKGTYHTFTETVSTVRSALELKQVFDQIAEAEKSGATEEEKKKLEEQAAEKGLRALFKGTKLEIESVVRETCDRVLNPPPGQQAPGREKLALRTRALQILGEAYCAVKKDGEGEINESEYVRIDTRASKDRESGTR